MRQHRVLLRLSKKEKNMLDRASATKGLPSATWARIELLQAAKMVGEEAHAYVAKSSTRLPLLSLFCGPGGLDEGFRQAGFYTQAATDLDPECVRTFQVNHPESRTLAADINSLTIEKLDKLLGERIAPVGVLGGPPCQCFSVSNVHQKQLDARYRLPEMYARLLKKLNERGPISFFVFENVPGLLGKKHIEKYHHFKGLFHDAGFELNEWLLDAKDYGVPQERFRVFVVGINRELYPKAVLTPPPREEKTPTVRDTIFGLPEPLQNGKGADPSVDSIHPNHWCLVPRSKKFHTARLEQGQAYGRSFRTLCWDKPSWTVAYGHREVHVHPTGLRRLSIYEAMLLQSFPRYYRLTGNLSAQIRLVSEAVPPRLAWHIARAIRTGLGI
jgi:DNA (cytosine-5)-methyltransferase 1